MLMGWPLLQGIAVGSIVCVASTMVMMRLLMDRGELSSEAGRVMITLTLVEDLAVIVLTVLLPSLAASDGANYAQVAWKITKALLLLVPVVLAGWKLASASISRSRPPFRSWKATATFSAPDARIRSTIAARRCAGVVGVPLAVAAAAMMRRDVRPALTP